MFGQMYLVEQKKLFKGKLFWGALALLLAIGMSVFFFMYTTLNSSPARWWAPSAAAASSIKCACSCPTLFSEYTVKGHVSNILSKLHLADHTQAAVFAWQHGVVRRGA